PRALRRHLEVPQHRPRHHRGALHLQLHGEAADPSLAPRSHRRILLPARHEAPTGGAQGVVRTSVVIRPLASEDEARVCSRLMAQSEPWITLGRSFEAGLKMLLDPLRERYVALVEGEIAGFVVLVTHGALVGYIQTICIAPTSRSLGIGTELMAFAEQR